MKNINKLFKNSIIVAALFISAFSSAHASSCSDKTFKGIGAYKSQGGAEKAARATWRASVIKYYGPLKGANYAVWRFAEDKKYSCSKDWFIYSCTVKAKACPIM